jgi:hypothetical protein
VGIGTTTPAGKLTLSGTQAVLNSNTINFYNDGGTNQRGVLGQLSSGSDFTIASVSNGDWLRLGANNGGIAFYPDNTVNGGIHPAMTVTLNGNVGIGTSTPNSPLQVKGSLAVPYDIDSVTNDTLTAANHTVRRFGQGTNLVFPDASSCRGRTYVIINSNGTGSNLNFTTVNSQGIYDDVTNTNFTYIAPNTRIQVQSDGTGWIVIGR